MGDHTDYNDGLVLPMPIPLQTRVELHPRDDRRVLLSSANQSEPGSYVLGEERKSGRWFDYVQGITAALASSGGLSTGFSLSISSDIPQGAGLASSAALEVALLRALRSSFGLTFDDVALARIGQRAEVDFVGAPTGLMDQLASSIGLPEHALAIDMRSLQTRAVALPASLELVVIASGVTHAHEGPSGYRQRRLECDRACASLGVRSLRDVASLEQAAALEEPLLRRVRHVLSENERVSATVEALAQVDLPALRALFAASHASLRDDYEVSVPELDLLIRLAADQPEIVAARMTGGGFGGSVVMLAERGHGKRAGQQLCASYQRDCGRAAQLLLPA
jgi:galactokinase